MSPRVPRPLVAVPLALIAAGALSAQAAQVPQGFQVPQGSLGGSTASPAAKRTLVAPADPALPHHCDLPADGLPWSDPDTWGGALPGWGQAVRVPAGKTIVLDTSPPPLESVTVEGRLDFGCADVTLRTDLLVVHGELHAGSAAYPDRHRVTIELGERILDPADPLARTLQVRPGAKLELHGQPRAPSWLRLAATAPAGATSIQLPDPVDWEPGERIVLASTDFDQDQAESRTIVSVAGGGTLLGLDAPLWYTHWGDVETLGVVERAEVALVDRNVVIQGHASASVTRRGAQMMFRTPDVHVSWIELRRMGDAGQLGRYPAHFHMVGDAQGASLVGLSIHHCFNRSLTIHGTQNVLVADTLSWETLGHAFFLEDSTETGNRFLHDLGLGTRRPAAADQILASDATPATFWIQNTDNVLIGNVAAGSSDHGFWYDIPSGQAQKIPVVFEGNVAHSNGQNGFYKSDYSGGAATGTSLYEAFTSYKNRLAGVHFRSSGGQAIWCDARVADNATGFFLASDGLQKDGGSHTLLRDSFVVGESDNLGTPVSSFEQQYGRSLPDPFDPDEPLLGHEVYEGRVEVRDTIFASFRDVAIAGQLREAGAFAQTRFVNTWAIDPRNRVAGISFQLANPVWLKPTPALANGYASLLLLDEDGSLTGAPMRYLSADTPLLTPPAGSTYVPDWNATIQPAATPASSWANLRLIDQTAQDIPQVTLSSLTRGTSFDVGITVNSYAYPMNVLVPDEYHVDFGAGPATRDFKLELRFGLPQASALVGVDYAQPGPGQVDANGVTLAPAASLPALTGQSGNGWFYDAAAERLWIQLVLGGSGTTVMDGTQAQFRVYP